MPGKKYHLAVFLEPCFKFEATLVQCINHQKRDSHKQINPNQQHKPSSSPLLSTGQCGAQENLSQAPFPERQKGTCPHCLCPCTLQQEQSGAETFRQVQNMSKAKEIGTTKIPSKEAEKNVRCLWRSSRMNGRAVGVSPERSDQCY